MIRLCNRSLSTTTFVGLGNMGGPMFLNLARHGSAQDSTQSFVGHDVSEQHRQTVAEKGGSAVRIISENDVDAVLDETTTLLTMLPNGGIVGGVVQRALARWAAAGGADGRLIVDCSTIDPHTVRQLGQDAAKEGATLVDAPVSGGVMGAANGTLTFMVGAAPDDAHYQRVADLLHPMAGNIIACGSLGNGQVAKLANNLVLACSMVGVAEAFAVAEALGLPPTTLQPILATSTARCWSVDTYCPVPGVMEGVPASREYEGGFGASLMLKDLGLVTNTAAAAKVPLPLGGAAHQLYTLVEKLGLGGKDFGIVHQVLQGKVNK